MRSSAYPSTIVNDEAGGGVFDQFRREIHHIGNASEASCQQTVDQTLAEEQSQRHLATQCTAALSSTTPIQNDENKK